MMKGRMVAGEEPARKFTSAGPGQSPDKPHPTPKMAAPVTSLQSTLARNDGSRNSPPASGEFHWSTARREGANITSADPMTTASDGSQTGRPRARKEATFDGRVMPLKASPMAKTAPETTSHVVDAKPRSDFLLAAMTPSSNVPVTLATRDAMTSSGRAGSANWAMPLSARPRVAGVRNMIELAAPDTSMIAVNAKLLFDSLAFPNSPCPALG